MGRGREACRVGVSASSQRKELGEGGAQTPGGSRENGQHTAWGAGSWTSGPEVHQLGQQEEALRAAGPERGDAHSHLV